MIQKTVTYTDFNGNQRTEDFFFNLTPADVVMLQHSMNGGLSQLLDKIIKEADEAQIINYFKRIVLESYGIKSLDGRTHKKNKEIREEFESTVAYSEIFMELATDAKAAAEFINGIMPPQELIDKYTEKMKKLGAEADDKKIVELPVSK